MLLLSSLIHAQAQVDLTSVGPATPLSSKSKICNVLDYGAVADNATDIAPAIEKAFSSCAISGGATIYIPPGTYSCKSINTPVAHVKPLQHTQYKPALPSTKAVLMQCKSTG